MTEHDEMTVGEEQTEDGKFMRRIRSFVHRLTACLGHGSVSILTRRTVVS